MRKLKNKKIVVINKEIKKDKNKRGMNALPKIYTPVRLMRTY